jgi:ATP-dependent Clp protease ATP-binding subunit ClpA
LGKESNMSSRIAMRSFNNTLFKQIPVFKTCSEKTFSWIEKNIKSHINPSILYTVDKIIDLIDLLIPKLIMIGIPVMAGLGVQLTLLSMVNGIIPIVAYCLHEVSSRNLYPYDYLTNLTDIAQKNRVPQSLSNDAMLDLCQKTLLESRSLVVMGRAGVGKTSLINSLACHLLTKEEFKGRKIYQLNINDLRNDPRHSAERMKRIVAEIRSTNAILFIDEFHRLKEDIAGSNLSEFFKPLLEDKTIQIIGTTTCDEGTKLFEDIALRRRVEILALEEETDVVKQIEMINHHFSLPQNLLKFDHETAQEAITLAKIAFKDISMPASAIKILNMTKNSKIHQYNQSQQDPIIPIEVTKADLEEAAKEIWKMEPKPPEDAIYFLKKIYEEVKSLNKSFNDKNAHTGLEAISPLHLSPSYSSTSVSPTPDNRLQNLPGIKSSQPVVRQSSQTDNQGLGFGCLSLTETASNIEEHKEGKPLIRTP